MSEKLFNGWRRVQHSYKGVFPLHHVNMQENEKFVNTKVRLTSSKNSLEQECDIQV